MYKNEISEIERKIAELEEEKEGLLKKKELYSNFHAEQRLAIFLHSKFCCSDHAEQCGWFYEKENDPRIWSSTYSSHARWLEKAKEVLEFFDEEIIKERT